MSSHLYHGYLSVYWIEPSCYHITVNSIIYVILIGMLSFKGRLHKYNYNYFLTHISTACV